MSKIFRKSKDNIKFLHACNCSYQLCEFLTTYNFKSKSGTDFSTRSWSFAQFCPKGLILIREQ